MLPKPYPMERGAFEVGRLREGQDPPLQFRRQIIRSHAQDDRKTDREKCHNKYLFINYTLQIRTFVV